MGGKGYRKGVRGRRKKKRGEREEGKGKGGKGRRKGREKEGEKERRKGRRKGRRERKKKNKTAKLSCLWYLVPLPEVTPYPLRFTHYPQMIPLTPSDLTPYPSLTDRG